MQRRFVNTLSRRLKSDPAYIQIILGPRQVGKTTGVLQLEGKLSHEVFYYHNADSIFSGKEQWLKNCWLEARVRRKKNKNTILVIDEVQSIPNWSSHIKGLWDQDKREDSLFHVILLGSSSLELHQGLSESLAGRFEQIYVPHWSYAETKELYPNLGLDEYMDYGGYPAPFSLNETARKDDYLRYSILEPVITKDILQNTTVKKPALFRQTFELACLHAAEILSLNKFLGQLQEGGNVDLVKHYLSLYQKAFLLKTLEKYSTNRIQKKGSSPKLMPMAPAFLNLFGKSDRERRFELVCGLHLIRTYENVFYWREGNKEVDFVIEVHGQIIGIEVKAGKKRDNKGLLSFAKKFPAKTLMVTEENFEYIDEYIAAL